MAFLDKLITSFNISNQIPYHIQPKGSLSEVLNYLETGLPSVPVVTTKKLKTLAIIVDADESPQKRFHEILKHLNTNNIFNCPNNIGQSPIIDNHKISVFIYLFPNNRQKGSIETLCLETLDQQKMDCIKQYFNCLSHKSIDSNMTENNLSKSKFRVYFASPNPDEYVNSIIEVVDIQHTTVTPLKELLTEILQQKLHPDDISQSNIEQ